MVGPLPNKGAHHLLFLIDQLPVIGKIAAAVAHGVGVFAEDEGAGLLGVIQDRRTDALDGGVHHADHVHQRVVVVFWVRALQALVVKRTGGIPLFDVFGTRKEGLAKHGLVAHRPEDHAGAVLVTLHKGHLAVGDAGSKEVHFGVFPPQIVLMRAAMPLGRAVRFHVGLVHDVKAEGVAKQIEFGAVGVVRGADGIDVQLLHQAKIEEHILARDGRARAAVELVAVDALELDGLAVDAKDLAVDRNLAEADLLGNDLPVRADGEGIERGILGRPGTDTRKRKGCALAGGNRCSLLGKADRERNGAFIPKEQLSPSVRAARFELVVGHVTLGAREQIDAAEDARKAEFVLALQIGGDTPFGNLFL